MNWPAVSMPAFLKASKVRLVRSSSAKGRAGEVWAVGIEPFDVDDEIYIIEHSDDIDVLLHTRWGGEALGGRQVEVGDRPLMYRRRVGDGGVLYLALGHCNRPFDTPSPEGRPQPDRRGPWEMLVYKELIRRGLAWAARRV